MDTEGKMETIKRVILVLLLCMPAFADYDVDGNLRVDGGYIGIESDTDLLQLAEDFLTVNGRIEANRLDVDDVRLDGSTLTTTANALAIGSATNVTNLTGTLNVSVQLGTSAIAGAGNLGITSPDGVINFGDDNPTTTGDTISDELIITHPTTNYKLSGRGGYFTLAPVNAAGAYIAAPSSFQLYSGDTTVPSTQDCYVSFYAVGSPDDVSNREDVMFGFSQAAQRYQFRAGSFGDGVQHPIHIWATDDDTDQLYIDHQNGRIGIQDSSPSYGLDLNGTFRGTGNGKFDSELDVTGAITFNHVDSCTGFIDVANDGGMSNPGDDTKVVSEQAIESELDSRIALGSDLIVNGDFDTDTDWVKEACWTIDTETKKAHFAGAGTSASFDIYTEALITSIQYSKMYLLTFNVENLSDAKITFVLFGANTNNRTILNSQITENGTYKFYFVAQPIGCWASDGDTIKRITFIACAPDSPWTGTLDLDNVTLKEIEFFGGT